jgi:hypothetical protein
VESPTQAAYGLLSSPHALFWTSNGLQSLLCLGERLYEPSFSGRSFEAIRRICRSLPLCFGVGNAFPAHTTAIFPFDLPYFYFFDMNGTCGHHDIKKNLFSSEQFVKIIDKLNTEFINLKTTAAYNWLIEDNVKKPILYIESDLNNSQNRNFRFIFFLELKFKFLLLMDKIIFKFIKNG